MEFVSWTLTPQGTVQAAGEDPATEQTHLIAAFDAFDREAYSRGLWLVGRVSCARKGRRLMMEACVLPPVALPDYCHRTAELRLRQPSVEQIDRQLSAIARRRQTFVETDNPAAAGDRVTLDFDAVLENGQRFSGSMGRDAAYTLDSNGDLPLEVRQAIVGRQVGQAFACDARLSGDGKNSMAAGRIARYTGTIKRVERPIVPPVDDTLALSLGQPDLAALRAELNAQALEQQRREGQRAVLPRVFHAICAETALELPPLAAELEAEEQERQLMHRLQSSGITLESHLRRLRKTQEQLQADLLRHAHQDVKMRAVFLAIARAEGMELTEDDVHRAELTARRGRQNMQIDRMQLRQRMLVERAMRLVAQCTTLNEVISPAAGAQNTKGEAAL